MTRWLCTTHRISVGLRSYPGAGYGEPRCCSNALDVVGGGDLSTWYQSRLWAKDPDVRAAIYDWRNLRTRDDQWRAIRLHAWKCGRVWREVE